jgi:hypothetical protein
VRVSPCTQELSSVLDHILIVPSSFTVQRDSQRIRKQQETPVGPVPAQRLDHREKHDVVAQLVDFENQYVHLRRENVTTKTREQCRERRERRDRRKRGLNALPPGWCDMVKEFAFIGICRRLVRRSFSEGGRAWARSVKSLG